MYSPTEPVDLRVCLRHDNVSGEHALVVAQAVRTVKGASRNVCTDSLSVIRTDVETGEKRKFKNGLK